MSYISSFLVTVGLLGQWNIHENKNRGKSFPGLRMNIKQVSGTGGAGQVGTCLTGIHMRRRVFPAEVTITTYDLR
jgi:hypothetical protein